MSTTEANAQRNPVGPMRKAIARNLMASLQSTAQVTSFFEVPSARLTDLRASLSDGSQIIGFDAILVAAAARVLADSPLLNGRMVDDAFLPGDGVHVGVAVALDESFGVGGGLVVPVIRDADGKTPAEIAAELADKVERARARRLQPDDMAGGTFTISNLGGLPGSAYWRGATPIISGSQSAILAVGRIRQAVVVGEHGEPAVAPILPLALTHDHRLIDGAVAGAFIDGLVATFDDPGVQAAWSSPRT